ncbi:Uncharacterised protein [uncultured archaeon]|nr:Uncharacterised protein [uncultured archaeon]
MGDTSESSPPIPSVISSPGLSNRHFSIMLVFMILAGLALLYAWPMDSAYLKSSTASVALMREGQWVALSAPISSVDERATGTSIQMCDENSHCVRAFAAQGTGPLELAVARPGQMLNVWGEVAVATGGTRFVRIHRASLNDAGE